MKEKICFMGFGTYPIIIKQKSYDVGGAELQQTIFGKELTKYGFDISFIDFDYGQDNFTEIEGIKYYKAFSPKNKYSLLSYIKYIPKIMRIMKNIDSDIYYYRTGIFFTTFLFCKIFKKKYIYAIAHDNFVEKKPIFCENFKRSLLYLDIKLNIKSANVIIVQTEFQKNMILNNFNRNSVLIKNSFFLNYERIRKNDNPLILWVATIKEIKNPESFIELSKKFPFINFVMIGGSSEDTDYYNQVILKTEKISNLNFVGFVPIHEIEQYFKEAWIFVNTSFKEGFPNTFLQAWANYTPVVSLYVDPDEVIFKNKLGFYSVSFEQMCEDINILLNNSKLREQMGINCRKYIEQEHDIQKNIKIFLNILNDM